MQHVQARRAAETIHCICSAADCGWSSLAELVLVLVLVIVIVIVIVIVLVQPAPSGQLHAMLLPADICGVCRS